MSKSLPACGALLALLLLGLAPVTNAQPPASQYFPQTGHSVGGQFLAYWQSHGRLAQQGYPISDEFQEKSDLNGQTYTVQYFERAEFELHTENQPPFNVLLSLLGALRYHQKYPNGAPGQSPNSSPGSVRFSQTGKRLGGSFLVYWKQYGGLMQQGYPISDEIQEKSELDGKIYTVQYFERSVMEWHPGNTPPYDVLLSQLGTFRYREKYPPVPASSTPSPLPTPQALATTILGEPVAAGRALCWLDSRGGQPALYAYNLDRHAAAPVPDGSGDVNHLSSDGQTVAWLSTEAGNRSVVRRYDPATGTSTAVWELPGTVEWGGLALSGDTLYYQDSTAGHRGLFARSLASGAERLISPTGQRPIAAGKWLLWSEERVVTPYPYPSSEWTLHLLDTDSRSGGQVIATSRGEFSRYSLDGSVVTWAALLPGLDTRVYIYQFADGTSRPVSAGRASYPLADGGRIAWTTEPAEGHPGFSLTVWDAATGKASDVVPDSPSLLEPAGVWATGEVAYTVNVPGTAATTLWFLAP